MNRNTEVHFSNAPTIDKPRSIFDRSCRHATSLRVGYCTPIYCDGVYPGDTVTVNTSKIIRTATLVAPIMDDFYLDTYWFFVPNRIVWSNWKNFFGDAKPSAWNIDRGLTVPQMYSGSGDVNKVQEHSVADYIGVPIVNIPSDAPVKPSALPFRAYAAIWNHFFRDENLFDPVNIPMGDADRQFLQISRFIPTSYSYIAEHGADGPLLPACKFHDYFTSCLPNAQKGSPSKLQMPVETMNVSGSGTVQYTEFSIDEFRIAMALQTMKELDARSGTRYSERLLAHWGVSAPDACIDDPQYLGGNRVRLNIASVANTAQTDSDALGDLGANSVTTDGHFDFQHSFTEHGTLMCIAVIRYDHTYSQGLPVWLSRRNAVGEFYDPLFADINELPVHNSEIYYQGNADDQLAFGFQEAWADLRVGMNRVSALMRPNVANTLASWNLSDNYTQLPKLSPAWIAEDGDLPNRVFTVSNELTDQFFGDFWFDMQWTRVMPMYSIPGRLGHF